MAIDCELFVSRDGIDYTKLDLSKNESIVVKYLRKDTQDLSKVSAPFSQGFSIDATPKNLQALGFYGNTYIDRPNNSNVLQCKIYIKGNLNNTGLLKIEGIKYKNNKINVFNVSFNSNILSLKDRIGDDTLRDLGSFITAWTPENVKSLIQSIKTTTINGIQYKYYCPLYSNNRVWNYDPDLDSTDNIYYRSTSNPFSDRVIAAGELMPAIALKTLFSLIKNKYNLIVNMPIETQAEFNDAFIWCNSVAESETNVSSKLIITHPFSNGSSVRTDLDPVNSSIWLRSVLINNTFIRVKFTDVVVGSGNGAVDLKLVDEYTGEVKYTRSLQFVNGTVNDEFRLPSTFFSGSEANFFVYIDTSSRILWNNFEIAFKTNTIPGEDVSTPNNNSAFSNFKDYDLIKTLPNTKVIDFVNSILKTFNISIFDSSVNDDVLDFLTPIDIENQTKVYGKKEADYTRFVDKVTEKKPSSDYNSFNLKHKTSKYKSNVDYKNQIGVEYGQAIYSNAGAEKLNEYKIETEFSIIPPVTINGLPSVKTAYGFNSSPPNITNGIFRYTPNYDELTIFYANGTQSIPSLGIQNRNSSNVLITSALNSHVLTLPYKIITGKTLAFSPIIDGGIEYLQSLYIRYYANQIERLLDPNSLEHNFEITIPANEIFLNENINFAPNGFRLQNDIIIEETLYDILEANIDITTGKTKLKLLNK